MEGGEPGFTLVTSKRASKKAKAKTTEGPESRGMADPRSSPSKPESASKTSGTPGVGPSGEAEAPETAAGRRSQAADPGETVRPGVGSGTGPTGPSAGAAAPAETPTVASGLAGLAAARPGVPRAELVLSGCWKCGKEGHYRSNCPDKGKKQTKRKRSGATGSTMGGKQAKTGTEGPVVTKNQKPVSKLDFNWSKVTLVLLNKDGQPLTLEEYEEAKGNFVLKEVDLAMREGALIDINQWCWYQDRVEVKFANVVPTEHFRKLLEGHIITSKEKWEEDHMKLYHFTGKVDKATMKVPVNSLRVMVEKRRQAMGITGTFRLTKVVCQTPTGAIILISCDDEAKAKWGETSWKGNLVFTIPGSGDVVFQERSKGKKTLQEVSKCLEGLSMVSESPAPGALAGGKGT